MKEFRLDIKEVVQCEFMYERLTDEQKLETMYFWRKRYFAPKSNQMAVLAN